MFRLTGPKSRCQQGSLCAVPGQYLKDTHIPWAHVPSAGDPKVTPLIAPLISLGGNTD